MQVHKFPHCCGIAIVTHFGFDERHNWRAENRQELADVEASLRAYAIAAQDGTLRGNDGRIGAVGMLICALNNHQKDTLHTLLTRLGWRRAGKCNNLHTDGQTDVFTYRKVIAEATRE